MQCPKESCNGFEAAFFQVQIRSADEPMTGFYKVSACIQGTCRDVYVLAGGREERDEDCSYQKEGWKD